MENNNKNTSFIDHLEELRWRIVKMAIAVIVLAVTVFIFIEPLADTILMSMAHSDFITYRFFCFLSNSLGLGDAMCVEDIQVKTIETQMTKQFATSIYFSLVGGLVASFPYLAYQLWSFVKPGLKENEKKATSGIVFYSSILFLLGISFGYFIVSPLCVQFFSTYRISGNISFTPTFTSYYSLIVSTTLAAGLFFQLPIVIYILTKLGLMTPVVLKKYRKHALVGILILSAIITPPDFISQIIVSIPVYLLYELSVRISGNVIKKQLKNV